MTTKRLRFRLTLQIVWELFLYDILSAAAGFQAVHKRAARRPQSRKPTAPDLDTLVPRAVSAASAFYWKPVRCLQRSVVAASVLKKHGVAAEVVIGCRHAPFAGHAWVEVGGRAINDTPGYSQKMSILERF